MNGIPVRNTLTRYVSSTVGLLLVALGIAFSIVSNLGTSPLTCPSYVLSLRWSPTVGEFTVMINTFLVLVQIAVLRKQFKAKYLMQIPATVVFGYMIDFWLWALSSLTPATFSVRILLILAGCVITAFGVSLEVVSQAWMLSAEMTVYAFTQVTKSRFSSLKVLMDSLFVVIAAVLSRLIFRNPFGSGELVSLKDILLARSSGIVIGAGTLVCAVLPGLLMRWSDPLVERFNSAMLRFDTSGKWRITRRS